MLSIPRCNESQFSQLVFQILQLLAADEFEKYESNIHKAWQHKSTTLGHIPCNKNINHGIEISKRT
jgi:galactokinase/mevalonate kinase-like predicted kinase